MATLNLESTTNKNNLIPSPVHIKHTLNETMVFCWDGVTLNIPKISGRSLPGLGLPRRTLARQGTRYAGPELCFASDPRPSAGGSNLHVQAML